MSNFSRCLKVTKEDIKDTFKSLEKRLNKNITVEPYVKETVFAFHYWVKTCFWLNIDPEQVPFPTKNASATLEKSEAYNQFIEDASDNKKAYKPEPFTKDDKWDEWGKTFEDYLSSIPGSTGLPLSCIERRVAERGGSNQKSNCNQQGNTNQRGNRIIQSLMSQFKDSVAESVSEITQQNTTPPGLPSSIMGGRNAQEKRNKGGRNE